MEQSQKLKEVRKNLNLTQKEMAEKLGIKQSYYSALELGKKQTSANVTQSIINLGVSANWWHNSIGAIFSSVISNLDLDSAAEGNYMFGHYSLVSPTKYADEAKMTTKQVNWELSNIIDVLKRVYNDIKALIESLHTMNAPDFLLEKFKKPVSFEDYKKRIDADFLEVHKHLDERSKKLRMINVLYIDEVEHQNWILSNLINYISIYADLIRDTIIMSSQKDLQKKTK